MSVQWLNWIKLNSYIALIPLNQSEVPWLFLSRNPTGVVRVWSVNQQAHEFALDLFNTWGIGQRDRNNGILLLVSYGDRRIEM